MQCYNIDEIWKQSYVGFHHLSKGKLKYITRDKRCLFVDADGVEFESAVSKVKLLVNCWSLGSFHVFNTMTELENWLKEK